MKINETLLDALQVEIESGNTVFLSGEPGIGKTSLGKSLARRDHSKCFVVSMNLMADKADLTGGRLLPTPDGKSFEQKFFAHHRVREAVQYANENPRSRVYLMLDEINRTTPDVTSGGLSIPTERELGDQKLPENITVIVTGNTRGNVVALDDASLSRFVIYQIEPDAPTLIAHLDARDGGARPMNTWCKEALIEAPDAVFEKSKPTTFSVADGADDDDDEVTTSISDLMDAGEEMLQLTTPRTIEGLSDWLDKAPDKLLMTLTQTSAPNHPTALHEVIHGHVGDTRFAALVIGKITASLASGNAPAASGPVIPKPGCWAQVAAISTRSDLDDFVAQLNDDERSGTLVYALHDKSDNAALIEQLLAHGTVTTGSDMTNVVDMLRTDSFDSKNLQVLMESTNPAADAIKSFANALGKG